MDKQTHRNKANRSQGQTICYCRVCEAEKQKERSRKEKELFVNAVGGQCSECGRVDYPCIYDFHHRYPKEKDFKISSKHKFEDIQQELDKCDLLCCLCHRKLHASIFGE